MWGSSKYLHHALEGVQGLGVPGGVVQRLELVLHPLEAVAHVPDVVVEGSQLGEDVGDGRGPLVDEGVEVLPALLDDGQVLLDLLLVRVAGVQEGGAGRVGAVVLVGVAVHVVAEGLHMEETMTTYFLA